MKFDLIKKAIATHKNRMSQNIMEDGRMRWEYYNVQRRVAQAACVFNGYIVTGTRHFCPIMGMQIDAIGHDLLEAWMKSGGYSYAKQGFTDQYGNFLTRREAYVIAKEAGQIWRDDYEPGVLYSECYI